MSIPSLQQFNEYKFEASGLTTDAGVIAVTTFLGKTGAVDWFQTVPFDDSRITPQYSNADILNAKLLYTFTGCQGCQDRSKLGKDALFCDSNIPSASTESRLYDRITPETNQYIMDMTSELVISYLAETKDVICLDQDSTICPTQGHQELAAYIPHYKETGYHPLLLTERSSHLILTEIMRPGNTAAALGGAEQITPVVNAVRQKNPDIDIYFTGDAANYSDEFMCTLEKLVVEYYIRTKNTGKFTRAVMDDLEQKKIDWMDYTEDKPCYGEIEYRIHGSKVSRRVCYKVYRRMDKNGQFEIFPAVYAVMTSNTTMNAHQVMNFYEMRGDNENINKSVKSHCGGKKLSHNTMLKNEFDFHMSALMHNLFLIFQIYCMSKEDQSMSLPTFQVQLGKVAAKIVKHAHQKILNISRDFWNKSKLKALLDKVSAMKEGMPFKVDFDNPVKVFRPQAAKGNAA